MQILLKASIPKIGNRGEIVTVTDGYGRNYLLKHGLGIVPQAKDIAQYQQSKQKAAQTEKTRQEELLALSKKLDQVAIIMVRKTNQQGHLFAGIKEVDIAELISEKFKVKLDKSMVILPETIKVIGKYDIQVRFSPNLITKIHLHVKSTTE